MKNNKLIKHGTPTNKQVTTAGEAGKPQPPDVKDDLYDEADGQRSIVPPLSPEDVTVADILARLQAQDKPPVKVQISAYIDENVAKAFDKYGKKNGKGSKSTLINELLKQALGIK